MGPERRCISSALARCWRGVCYGLGFVSSAIFLITMFWILWCYLGLFSIQSTVPQRRALVHYPVTTYKPSNPTPSSSANSIVPRKDVWNSTTTPVPQASQNSHADLKPQSSLQRGSSRGERGSNTRKETQDTRTDDSLAKGNFDARDRSNAASNSSSTRSKGVSSDDRKRDAENRDRVDSKLGIILNGHDDTQSRESIAGDRKTSRNNSESPTVRDTSSENRNLKDLKGRGEKDSVPTVNKPKAAERDRDANDSRKVELLPASRDDYDDDKKRSRRPVDVDTYDERPMRDIDDYDRGRETARGYKERDLEPDRRPVGGRNGKEEPVRDVRNEDRRRSYERDMPRGRYDDEDGTDDRDRVRSPRRGEPGASERDRTSESRRDYGYDRDRPVRDDDRMRDDRYRTDDDLYRKRESSDRYDYADEDRYRTRSKDDRYRSRTDDDYRSSDDRYRLSERDGRYRDRLPEDEYRRRDDKDRTSDDRYRGREPDDDRYRHRVDPDRRADESRPRAKEEIDYSSTAERVRVDRKTDDYDIDKKESSRTYDPDYVPARNRGDKYDDRDRSRDSARRDLPSRYDDDYRTRDRDVPLRRDRPSAVDDRYDSERSSRRRDDVYDRKDYRSRGTEEDTDRYRNRRIDSDYDRPYRKDDDYADSRSSVRKGDDRVIDRERPIRISEDRELSRSLSSKPDEKVLEPRSYSNEDDKTRNRPRSDPKPSLKDRDDQRSSSRDDDDRRRMYESRSRDRFDDDYRTKGDYGRDRTEPYDRPIEDRRNLRKDGEDDRLPGQDAVDRQGSGAIRNDRPLRSSSDRLPTREVHLSDDRGESRDSKSPTTSTVDKGGDTNSRPSSSREDPVDRIRPVGREKRFQDTSRQHPEKRDGTTHTTGSSIGDEQGRRSNPHDDSPRRDTSPKSPVEDDHGNPTRPLTTKEVIEEAYRHTDVSEGPEEVHYPVFDPRVSNMTSSEVIRANERRGTVITSRRKRK